MKTIASLLIEEEGVVRRVAIGRFPAVLGRDESCAVVLTAPSASRVHARIEEAPHGVAIVDLDSANGTYLNGVRIRKAMIVRGSEIRIGEARLVFTGGMDVAPASEPAAEAPARKKDRAADPAAVARPAEERRTANAAAEPNQAAEAPPPPNQPMNARTRRVANLVTVGLFILLNGGLFVGWNIWMKSKAPPPTPAFVPRSTVAEPEVRIEPPSDPESAARRAWGGVESDVARHVAAERFPEAFAAVKAFLAEHGGSRVAVRALDRMSAVRVARDKLVENCLAHAEAIAKLGDVASAEKSLELARGLLGGEEDARVQKAAAAVAKIAADLLEEAKRKAAKPKPPPPKKAL